jgi:hypothetical protein
MARRGDLDTVSRRDQLAVASTKLHGMLKLRAAPKVQPPDLVVLLHLIINASEYPDTAVPDPAGMIVARYKSPSTGPGPGLQVEVTYIVQYTIVASLSSANVQLVVVDHC